MEDMAPWEIWVRGTGLSRFVLDHFWGWPIAESLHFLGLSLLIGTVGLFDLRLLGMTKSIAPAALHRLIPWGIGGYVLNLCTGIYFFFGYPEQYAYNRAFHFKLAFMAVAGLNLLFFYGMAFRGVKTVGPGADTAWQAKVMAGISLAMWLGIIIAGRLITFFRPPFFH